MSADEWLKKNNRKPYFPDDGDPAIWYWGCEEELRESGIHLDEIEDSMDMCLPAEVYNRLMQHTTYPDVKMYKSEALALEDFYQAFDAAVAAGWNSK